jgi:hypothetical protein
MGSRRRRVFCTQCCRQWRVRCIIEVTWQVTLTIKMVYFLFHPRTAATRRTTTRFVSPQARPPPRASAINATMQNRRAVESPDNRTSGDSDFETTPARPVRAAAAASIASAKAAPRTRYLNTVLLSVGKFMKDAWYFMFGMRKRRCIGTVRALAQFYCT